jgi:hypothetical protein
VPTFDVVLVQDVAHIPTELDVEFDSTTVSDFVVEATRPMSAGITTPSAADYRIIGTGASGLDDIDILAMYQRVFGTGPLPSGASISVRIASAAPTVGQISKIKPHKKFMAELY